MYLTSVSWVWVVTFVVFGLVLALHRKTLPAMVLVLIGGIAAVVPGIRLLYGISQDLSAIELMSERAAELEADRALREIRSQPRYADPKRLPNYEAKVFSRGGDDGIIAEVFRRIGTTNQKFAEFGSGDGVENNTINLLLSGWSGLWIEGEAERARAAAERFRLAVSAKRLTIIHSFVTAENIESLFARATLPEQFDLLSIDIDRNDYWVWQAIKRCRPRVVVVEYNSLYPPGMERITPYDPAAWWDGTSNSGASLSSFEKLGADKGYALVSCDLTGSNAYFVRSDQDLSKFAAPFTAANHYEPPREYLVHRSLWPPRNPVFYR